MANLLISNGSVSIDRVEHVLVKPHASSYIPRLLTFPIFCAAGVSLAQSATMVITVFLPAGNKRFGFSWDSALGIFMGIVTALISLAVAGSAAVVMFDRKADLQSVNVLRWALGIAAAFSVLLAVFSFKESQDYAAAYDFAEHYKFASIAQNTGMFQIGGAIVLVLTIVSFWLLNMKNITLVSKDGRDQVISFVNLDDVRTVVDAVDAQHKVAGLAVGARVNAME